MNWEEISKKYPKGYSLLRGYAKTSKPEFVCSKIIKGIRYLYDFFDEQSIFIIVDLEIQHTRTIDEDGENHIMFQKDLDLKYMIIHIV